RFESSRCLQIVPPAYFCTFARNDRALKLFQENLLFSHRAAATSNDTRKLSVRAQDQPTMKYVQRAVTAGEARIEFLAPFKKLMAAGFVSSRVERARMIIEAQHRA